MEAFFLTFTGIPLTEEDCSYDPATRVADCAARGKFAPDPPLAGEDVNCVLLTVDAEPVGLRCSSAVPLRTLYYQIP